MNIVPFKFEEKEVRVQVDGAGQPWFNAADVCAVLQHANARKALADHVDPEDVTKRDTLTAGGTQSVNHINESGLYALILGSTKPEAKRFKRWVTSEVLPAIRKTGSYTQPQHETQDLHVVNINADWCKRVSYVAVMYEQFVTMFERAIGLSANQARISACRLLAKHTGVNVLEDSGTLLEAPYAESLFNPTDLGKQVGMSARQVNTAFSALGLQTSQRDAKGNIHYQPTEVGLRHGVLLDTDKRHHSGTPVLQLKWRSSVLPILQAWLQTEAHEDGDTGDYLLE